MAIKPSLSDRSVEYLDYLEKWLSGLSPVHFPGENVRPDNVSVMVVDMTKGFCDQGALSSTRVRAVVKPIVKLLRDAWKAGVRNLYLLNDTHEADAVEFKAFPPHCVKGTEESQPVDEIKALEFFDQIMLIPKNSISSSLDTSLSDILSGRTDLTHFIVVGNCTDLCVYQMAMYLRLDANARQDAKRRVIVPENCVATFDMGIEAAKAVGAVPHPGDLFHATFLHHLFLNGVEVVKRADF
jgi:nicotinamidase-related amidase